jgi:hypothetical protein
LLNEFKEVAKLEITDENIPKFRELRLKFQKNRTQGINKWHKTAKDYFLRGGQFVDAIKRKEIAVNEDVEAKLMEAEKYFEIQEQKRIEKLQQEREKELSKYVDDTFGLDLGNMQDEVWNAFLQVKKKEYEDRLEAERKAEQERIERERKEKLHNERKEQILPYWQFVEPELKDMDLSELTDKNFKNILKSLKQEQADYEAEQERIRKENERLRKERELAEKKRKEAEEKAMLEAERIRKENEERLRKEREEKAKLEAELKAKQEEEQKRLAEIEAKKQAELQKGDAEKLNDFITDLDALKSKYAFKSKVYQKKYNDAKTLIDKIILHIQK